VSAAATAWAWAQPGLAADEKLVLLSLAEDANHKCQCWPSREVLHQRTGLRDELLAAALLNLREHGLVRAEAEAGKSTQYFLRLDQVASGKQRREVAPVEISADAASLVSEAVAYWNAMAARTARGPKEHRLSKVKVVTDTFKRKLILRLKEGGIDGWRRAVDVVEASAHCRGMNGWRASFSYLLQAKGFSKSVNGEWPADYEEASRGGTRTATGPAGRGYERQDGLRGFDAAVRGRAAQEPGLGDGEPPDRRQPEPALGGPQLPLLGRAPVRSGGSGGA
jgi:hypothetical protein